MSTFSRFAVAIAAAALIVLPVLADEAPVRPKPNPDKPVEKTDEIKLPWTQEEVVAASKKGMAYKFEIVSEGGGSGTASFEISEVTDLGFMMRSVMVADGSDMNEDSKKKTWEAHLGGLVKRLKGSVATQESIETKAGKFDCTLFTKTVDEEDRKSTEKMWLSKELPGMMIKAERYSERGGKVDSESWTLVSHDVLRVKLPWQVKEIVAAWKDGASMKYTITSEKGDAGWVLLAISEVNDAGFTQTTTEAIEGKPEKTRDASKRTWEQYLREFAVPRHNATVSEETIEVKAGKFECLLVTVVEKGENSSGTQKLWFAKKEPGLLVKMSIDGIQNGKPDKEGYELVEFKKGR